MASQQLQYSGSFSINPIGSVRRSDQGVYLSILEPYRPGLRFLGHFSHAIVLWWADKHDNPQDRTTLRIEPPYAPGNPTGVFACRSPYRPNPVGLTVCHLIDVDEAGGLVKVVNIDALDGTPIIDLKAYFPVSDRVREASIPEWLVGWPEWFPEEGLGLK